MPLLIGHPVRYLHALSGRRVELTAGGSPLPQSLIAACEGRGRFISYHFLLPVPRLKGQCSHCPGGLFTIVWAFTSIISNTLLLFTVA